MKKKRLSSCSWFRRPLLSISRKSYKENYSNDYYKNEIYINNDHQSATNTPMALRPDNMTIKPRGYNKNKANKSFYNTNSRYDKIRVNRAKIILSRENSIRKVNNKIYLVQSQTGMGWYKIQWNGKDWSCNCPDNVKNGNIHLCKHLLALKIKYDSGFYETVEETPKIEPVKYTQNWKTYNDAQSQEIELFDQFLTQLVSTIDEPDQHMGRPRLKLEDQIFCCIMKTYSQLSLRRANCLYQQAAQRQQISHAPHYAIVSATLLKPEITPILHDLVHLSALPVASIETDFIIDSSGFRCSSFGRYCEHAHGTKRMHNWLKVHICTGVNTNIVADVIITDEHGADSPQFEPLIRGTAEGFNINEVSADGIYSSRKNHEIVHKLGGRAYIPFRKDATGKAGGSILWKQAFHYFQFHHDEFEEHYHKRSNAESTFAAIKKKFGETIKSRKHVAQENEMLCKIIAYNITVLIHEMIALGDTSDILLFTGLCKEQTLSETDFRSGLRVS